MNRRAFLAILTLSAVSVCCNAAEPAAPAAGKARIVLTGDSTVAAASGWGTAFTKLVGPEATCLNLAKGGASTKSFSDSGLWAKAIAAKPAWILIQFGHNDQPGKGPERETDPKTTYSANLSRFIDEARAAGAKPVLVTSLTRRTMKDGHIVPDGLVPFVEAARNVAAEKKVPLVELYARSIEYIEKLSAADLAAMEPPGKTPDTIDHTHLTARGGEMIAPLIVAELQKVAPDLARLLKPAQ